MTNPSGSEIISSSAPEVDDEAMRAFVDALSTVQASAATRCLGWSAH